MKSILKFLFIATLLSLAINSQGQIKVDLNRKINSKVNQRVNKNVDKTIDKGLDAVENGAKEDPKTTEKTDQTNANQNNQANKSAGNDNKTQADKSGGQEQTKLEATSKYDFVPGDKVILFEDFSQDALGDFPALWTTDVAGEINTLNIGPGNWFNLNSTEGNYWFMKDIDFPQNFILEMDIVPKEVATRIAADLVIFGEDKHSEMDKNYDPGTCGIHIKMQKDAWYTSGYKKGASEKLEGSSRINPVEAGKINHVIVWVQNRRVRIYHKGAKVIDVPTNIYEGSKFKRLSFKLSRGASCSSYISNIKITTASPDMRSKLLTEGKLISYGIYFDVNKDVVKPESFGTLKGIADVLKENPDVRVKIVGHTDSDGADAANLDLSKRRGASVKDELVKTLGIDASRLETDGMGETKPVAPNDSPVNKALNRRVEFIKL
jgi:outer membrane protein OmpA-like peptidoglycan-associated protein